MGGSVGAWWIWEMLVHARKAVRVQFIIGTRMVAGM